MTRVEQAVDKYNKGYNCAQAVLCAFADDLGMDESILYKMAESFGAGIGSGMGVCGAMSGAAILTGLVNSDGKIEEPGNTKRETTRIGASISMEFIERTGAYICRDIKRGVDGVALKSCADCVAIATELAEKAFFNK